MKKKIQVLACAAVLAVSGVNVFASIGGNASDTVDIQIDGVEMLAEGDGGGWGWLAPLGAIADAAYNSLFTGKEWVDKGTEEDYSSLFYGSKKYLCESSFFGRDHCEIGRVQYDYKPVN